MHLQILIYANAFTKTHKEAVTMEMNYKDVVEGRRSIRKFKSEQVPKEVLEEILRQGTLAPSGKNR